MTNREVIQVRKNLIEELLLGCQGDQAKLYGMMDDMLEKLRQECSNQGQYLDYLCQV
ncbi:MAG: hypothetical protein ACRCTE_01100 [Cellulosilyticaceae bacterium]